MSRRLPSVRLPSLTGRVQSWTADGGDVLVTGFVWENPRPEAEIAEVCYHAAASDAAIAVLAAVEGV